MIATLIGSFSPTILSIHLIMAYTAGILTQERLYPLLIVPAALEIALLIFSSVLRWKNTPALGAFLRMMRDPVAHA